jgi:hypothetical protein
LLNQFSKGPKVSWTVDQFPALPKQRFQEAVEEEVWPAGKFLTYPIEPVRALALSKHLPEEGFNIARRHRPQGDEFREGVPERGCVPFNPGGGVSGCGEDAKTTVQPFEHLLPEGETHTWLRERR